jgi:hypothetical protein
MPAVDDDYPASILKGGAVIVWVQFRSERDARQFAAALVDPPLWIGRVNVSACGD